MIRHLTSILDMQAAEILELIKEFDIQFPDLKNSVDLYWRANEDTLKTKIILTVFLQKSTRTKTSFMSSFMRMGGSCISYDSLNTDLQNNNYSESIEETGRFLSQYCDLIVIRTPEPIHVSSLKTHSRVPVISAGHGEQEHPTSAISQLHTIWKTLGRLSSLKVLVIAKFPKRCCHSLINGILQFQNQEISIVSPSKPSKMAEWILSCRHTPSTVRWTPRLTTLIEQENLREFDIVICDEGESDYKQGSNVELAGYITTEILSHFRKDILLMHLKPLINMFDEELAQQYRPILAQQSRKSALMRAIIMKKLVLGLI